MALLGLDEHKIQQRLHEINTKLPLDVFSARKELSSLAVDLMRVCPGAQQYFIQIDLMLCEAGLFVSPPEELAQISNHWLRPETASVLSAAQYTSFLFYAGFSLFRSAKPGWFALLKECVKLRAHLADRRELIHLYGQLSFFALDHKLYHQASYFSQRSQIEALHQQQLPYHHYYLMSMMDANLQLGHRDYVQRLLARPSWEKQNEFPYVYWSYLSIRQRYDEKCGNIAASKYSLLAIRDSAKAHNNKVLVGYAQAQLGLSHILSGHAGNAMEHLEEASRIATSLQHAEILRRSNEYKEQLFRQHRVGAFPTALASALVEEDSSISVEALLNLLSSVYNRRQHKSQPR